MDNEFLSTIEPYENNIEKWWVELPIKDIRRLKPEPDRDILLILGDAWCVMDDFSKFLDFEVPFDLMAINYAAKVIPAGIPIQHFIAGDSHTPPMQRCALELEGKGTIRHCWNRGSKGFDVRWGRNTAKGWTGTTANLGIKIGIALGYMKIVLAGCPMDGNGNWYKDTLPANDIKRFKDHTAHLWKWTEIASRPIGRFIRSMSGNTAMLFGEPDQAWLEDV